MTALALDTLKVAKKLRDAGFSEAQAESVTDVIREGLGGGDFASKADLASTEMSVRSDLSKTEARLKAEIADVKAEIIKWMFGAMLAQGALVVTLIKLLPGK